MTVQSTPRTNGDDPEGPDVATATSSAPRKRRQRSFWAELPFLVVLAFVLALLVRAFLVQAFYIPSESMENTLLINDKVVVNKLAYKVGDIHRGDIVVFNVIGLWKTQAEYDQEMAAIAPTNPLAKAVSKVAGYIGFSQLDRDYYIKRAIGVGGDTVACCDTDGRVTVNKVPLQEEGSGGYLYPGSEPSETPFSVTVPPGYIWVMGDNRQNSSDSRAHRGSPGGGAVPVSAVTGRAFALLYPFNRATWFSTPPTFQQRALTNGVGIPAIPGPPTVPDTAFSAAALAVVTARRRRQRAA
jgi:signal peptidase I